MANGRDANRTLVPSTWTSASICHRTGNSRPPWMSYSRTIPKAREFADTADFGCTVRREEDDR